MNDNTVMILTGSGAAAVAVVRVRGPLCAEFLRGHFSRQAVAGRCVHGELRDGQRVIDDVIVVLDDGGESAEINLHGSPWTVGRAVELAKAFGFSVVMPPNEPDLLGAAGDSLLWREVAAWLPVARSELAVRMLGAQIAAWKQFSESAPTPGQLREIAADVTLWRILHPPCVAIVGRPNAGKSTLANRLFERERSITADVAGTARDWVGEYTAVDGLPVMLLDTPGIRDAVDPIESEAIESARAEIAGADLVLLLVDSTETAEEFPIQSSKVMRVFNKCDLPNCLAAAAEGSHLGKNGKGRGRTAKVHQGMVRVWES